MWLYELLYRLGQAPWERYATAAAVSIGAKLDREEADRPPGRALDLGCGRGVYAAQLAARGWEVVGVDSVTRAIEAAQALEVPGATFRVADVAALPSDLGRFDLFLDIGCFEHLDAAQRAAYAAGVGALANPGATVLMMEFQPHPLLGALGGVTQADVRSAFGSWRLVSVEPAVTDGLGWPMSRLAPQWYRLHRDDGEDRPD